MEFLLKLTKTKHIDGGSRDRHPGKNTDTLFEHADMELGKPNPKDNETDFCKYKSDKKSSNENVDLLLNRAR